MNLENIIGEYTSLKPGFWGDCPICKSEDCLFVKSDLWHCYSCGCGGNDTDFLMLVEQISFDEAVVRLAKHADEITEKRGPGRPKKKIRL